MAMALRRDPEAASVPGNAVVCTDQGSENDVEIQLIGLRL
jgi:hypothetical protein